MKKIFLLVTALSFSLLILMVPKAHAYTLSPTAEAYIYNRTTASQGQADLLDIGSTFIEYMYYDLGTTTLSQTTTIRMVFSNSIPTNALPIIHTKAVYVEISFYNASHQKLLSNGAYYNSNYSFSYYESNFTPTTNINNIDYLTISITGLQVGYNQDNAHLVMHGAIIGMGMHQIINQTVTTTQYTSGWNDAMNSKVTQIWSLWGNIFDTFMSIFDVFSIQLMGDITIGHIAMVPLVLGLIGFIYALGGKRGR